MPYSAVGQQLGELRFSGVATQRPPRPAASSGQQNGSVLTVFVGPVREN